MYKKTLEISKAFEKFAFTEDVGPGAMEAALYKANLTPYDRDPDDVGGGRPDVDMNAPFTQKVISVLDKHGVGAFKMSLEVAPKSAQVTILGTHPAATAELNRIFSGKMTRALRAKKQIPNEKVTIRGFLELT